MPSQKQCLKSQFELAQAVGEFMKYWGFKSIHGRIWCLLYLSARPRDAQYFIDNLKVSKGLVSLAIKDLLKYKVICKTELDPPSVLQHYKANSKVLEVILDVLRTRELKMLEKVKELSDRLQGCDSSALLELEVDAKRLEKLKDMTCIAHYTLQSVFEESFEENFGLHKINDPE
jgi:DNA-binding transcriptional regulator GbsR (MarR family)